MTALEKAKDWIKQSVTLKLITITIIMLLLLIPQSMITSLIYERQGLSNEAIREVSSKWANEQTISGPILTIPMVYKIHIEDMDEDEEDKVVTETRLLRVLPSEMNIDGLIYPKERKRGIYKIILYESDLKMSGSIKIPKYSEEDLIEVKWSEAYITMAISDLRGIVEDINFNLAGNELIEQSGSHISKYKSGITMMSPDLGSKKAVAIPFLVDLKLQGSGSLRFTPDGDVTNINLESQWPDPSFDGYVLPDSHETDESGFRAHWKLLQLNRNYPTSWIGSAYFDRQLASSFGVNLHKGTGHYQKSLRSAKYGAMIIALNFLVFFLVEILNKQRIHPFQYILVGVALILFFSMLVALSEHLAYNSSFMISAIATISMVALYTKSVLKNWKLGGMMALLLSAIYIFLFFTLQSTDYALLIGSIGLSMILAATMYFTRNIQWYNTNEVDND